MVCQVGPWQALPIWRISVLTADILLKWIEEDIWEFIFLWGSWGWFWWSARYLHLNFCWPTVNMVNQVFGKILRGNPLGKPLLDKAVAHTAGGGMTSVTVIACYRLGGQTIVLCAVSYPRQEGRGLTWVRGGQHMLPYPSLLFRARFLPTHCRRFGKSLFVPLPGYPEGLCL